MRRYRKAFLIVAVFISLPLLILSVINLLSFTPMGLGFVGQFIVLWWGLYFYLRTNSKPAFWFSFVLVNLHWWPLLFRIIRIAMYWINNAGTEKINYSVFFTTFTGYRLFETVFFVPLTFTFVFGLLVVRDFYKTSKSDQTSGLYQPE